jgi:hypothetical protein
MVRLFTMEQKLSILEKLINQIKSGHSQIPCYRLFRQIMQALYNPYSSNYQSSTTTSTTVGTYPPRSNNTYETTTVGTYPPRSNNDYENSGTTALRGGNKNNSQG